MNVEAAWKMPNGWPCKQEKVLGLKGHCSEFAHLPDRTADGDLLFTFSSNILDFLRSPSSYLKFGSRHEDFSRFCR